MNVERFYYELPTPIGPITLVSDGDHVTMVSLRPAAAFVRRDGSWRESAAVLATAREQLSAYFAGELRDFSLPLAPHGTPYQRKVWSALERIPYGVTTSYGAIATAIGHTNGARAVGAANGQNPIAIVVPCHRVIGHNGTLTGYGGGLERKSWLLQHEARVLGSPFQLQLGLVARA